MQVLRAGTGVRSISYSHYLLRTTCLATLLAAILAPVLYIVAAHMQLVTVRDTVVDPGMSVPVEVVVVMEGHAKVFQVRFLVQPVLVGVAVVEVESRYGRKSLHLVAHIAEMA